MCKAYYFVTIDGVLYAVLNNEQQCGGSSSIVMYPMSSGRLEIFKKLKSKDWEERAIHERLFPRNHVQGRWTQFCRKSEPDMPSIESLMTWSKAELAEAIRLRLHAPLPTLQHMSKRDVAVLAQRLHIVEIHEAESA